MTVIEPHLLGSDAARVKLRAALVEHIHSKPPPTITGYHRWKSISSPTTPPLAQPVKLLVGDPLVLAVSPPTHTYIHTHPPQKKI
jgi:hypothetical protein